MTEETDARRGAETLDTPEPADAARPGAPAADGGGRPGGADAPSSGVPGGDTKDTAPTAETERLRPPAQKPGEIGGPEGPEPTRYGDWEVKGRCTDF